jgi:hypothetical protein
MLNMKLFGARQMTPCREPKPRDLITHFDMSSSDYGYPVIIISRFECAIVGILQVNGFEQRIPTAYVTDKWKIAWTL